MKDCIFKDFAKYIPLAGVIILVIAGVAALKLAALEKILDCCEHDCDCDCNCRG